MPTTSKDLDEVCVSFGCSDEVCALVSRAAAAEGMGLTDWILAQLIPAARSSIGWGEGVSGSCRFMLPWAATLEAAGPGCLCNDARPETVCSIPRCDVKLDEKRYDRFYDACAAGMTEKTRGFLEQEPAWW